MLNLVRFGRDNINTYWVEMVPLQGSVDWVQQSVFTCHSAIAAAHFYNRGKPATSITTFQTHMHKCCKCVIVKFTRWSTHVVRILFLLFYFEAQRFWYLYELHAVTSAEHCLDSHFWPCNLCIVQNYSSVPGVWVCWIRWYHESNQNTFET